MNVLAELTEHWAECSHTLLTPITGISLLIVQHVK